MGSPSLWAPVKQDAKDRQHPKTPRPCKGHAVALWGSECGGGQTQQTVPAQTHTGSPDGNVPPGKGQPPGHCPPCPPHVLPI